MTLERRCWAAGVRVKVFWGEVLRAPKAHLYESKSWRHSWCPWTRQRGILRTQAPVSDPSLGQGWRGKTDVQCQLDIALI